MSDLHPATTTAIGLLALTYVIGASLFWFVAPFAARDVRFRIGPIERTLTAALWPLLLLVVALWTLFTERKRP